MSPATTNNAKKAQSTWNDWRRKNLIEQCIDTKTAWSVNDPATSRDYESRFRFRRRNALAMTETELRLMAAPAMIGLRRMPNHG